MDLIRNPRYVDPLLPNILVQHGVSRLQEQVSIQVQLAVAAHIARMGIQGRRLLGISAQIPMTARIARMMIPGGRREASNIQLEMVICMHIPGKRPEVSHIQLEMIVRMNILGGRLEATNIQLETIAHIEAPLMVIRPRRDPSVRIKARLTMTSPRQGLSAQARAQDTMIDREPPGDLTHSLNTQALKTSRGPNRVGISQIPLVIRVTTMSL